jgi:hypothetical protein
MIVVEASDAKAQFEGLMKASEYDAFVKTL